MGFSFDENVADPGISFQGFKLTSNTKEIGDTLEDRVFHMLDWMFDRKLVPFDPEQACIHRKKDLWSEDRGAFISFENVVELFSAVPRADRKIQPTLIVIFECKNYPRGIVQVDEVEEFSAKLLQIRDGRPKGYIVTTGRFARGCTNFAQKNGIGLIRLFAEAEPSVIAHLGAAAFDEAERALTEKHYVAGTSAVAFGQKGFYTDPQHLFWEEWKVSTSE